MVLGYMCETHGFQDECGVDESGQRICRECGKAVTGLVGRSRSARSSPPEDEPGVMSGDIRWHVSRGRRRADIYVNAFDYQAAIEKAIEKTDNPQAIKEVTPADHRYRH